MSRIRTIKPDLTLDYELAQLGFAARYFFVNLWCHCDREGRVQDDPRKLQAQILPWDQDVSADKLLSELAPKFLVRYTGPDGKRYIWVRHFKEHQRPHPREVGSVIPEPTDAQSALKSKPCKKTASRVKVGMQVRSSPGKGRERILDTGNGEGVAPAAPQVEVSKPKELTPIQKVVRGFKEAKGVNANDTDWDRKFFARFARPAKELLEAFDGNAEAAIAFTLTKSVDWADLPDWGIEAVVRAAGREYHRIGETNGSKPVALDADRLDGPRPTHSTARAGELVGDAIRSLEAASVSAREPRHLAGPVDDRDYDAETEP